MIWSLAIVEVNPIAPVPSKLTLAARTGPEVIPTLREDANLVAVAALPVVSFWIVLGSPIV